MKNILAISGSTRKESSNLRLLKAIDDLTKDKFFVSIFNDLSNLPHFNPDAEGDKTPETIIHFRKLISDADGVIICTPEYAHGVPGSLKNAIDWTVASAEFSNKPTLLITASTDGQFGHNALLETLKVIEAKNTDELQLLISFIRTKVSKENKITDEKTLSDIKQLLEKLDQTINNN